MPNPYHYGGPVEGAQFTGRSHELEALVSRMREGINVIVVSPRRYGKTSLIKKAASSLVDDGGAVVAVNVLRCADVTVLAERLANHAFEIKGGVWRKARNAVAEFLQRIRANPSVTFSGDGTPKFTLAPSLAPADADRVIEDVYALLATESATRPAVLVLDEAQALFELGDHLPSLLKSLADDHPKVSLVLAGSKKHLMDRLATDRDAPLYGMAERIALAPLPEDVMKKFLVRRARAGKKTMTDAAARHLVELAGPVPNDIQHLAYEAFGVAGDEIGTRDVNRALDLIVEHEASLHADRFETLSSGQRRVLVRLAQAPVAQPSSAAFVRDTGLANASSVQGALSALEGLGLVGNREGEWVVADPFFAGWLRNAA